MITRSLVLVLAAAAAAITSGCGGGGATSPTGGNGGEGDTASADLAGGASGGNDLGAAPSDLAKSVDLAQPAPPTKKVLSFVWQGESDYYMCGPSAARMALSTRLTNLPSQQDLATYMGTTTNGTDYIGLVRGALNHYFAISAYNETDLPSDPPTQAQLDGVKQHLVASIDAGYGLVANVVSGWRPPFYPSGTIYHYVAVVGYDAGGDKVLIADPAATGCGNGLCGNASSVWYNTPKSYWINTSDLGEWITPKGYTWHP